MDIYVAGPVGPQVVSEIGLSFRMLKVRCSLTLIELRLDVDCAVLAEQGHKTYTKVHPKHWDNYKDYAYVGTLDGLYQHTLIATGTRLRPLEATFLGVILRTKPPKDIRV